MNHPETTWTDERLDRILGNLLRAGVLLSALVVLIGGIFYLSWHGGEAPNDKRFTEEPSDLRDPRKILSAALVGDSRALIQVGVLLLIATPVARVAFSVVAFLLQKDITYVVVTVIVLAVLMYGLVIGH